MSYGIKKVISILTLIAGKMSEDCDTLSRLDGLSGDGDLGESMMKSSEAIIQTVNASQYADIGELLMKTAMAMNKAAPSTLGTLLSAAVMAVAKETRGMAEIDRETVSRIPEIMAKAIGERGNASLGDKTILDSLIPMSRTVKEEFKKGNDLKQCYHYGAISAKTGADSTAGMIPNAGRAQWIGERVREHLDGGAVLCASVAGLFLLDE